jgi:hypothetical protein
LGALRSDGPTVIGGSAAHLGLDGIKLRDARKRLGRDRRSASGGDLIEAATDVSPAECQSYVAPLGESAIASVAIDLQNAAEAFEVGYWASALRSGA